MCYGVNMFVYVFAQASDRKLDGGGMCDRSSKRCLPSRIFSSRDLMFFILSDFLGWATVMDDFFMLQRLLLLTPESPPPSVLVSDFASDMS